MDNTDTLTRAEFSYLKTIEKSELLIEKLETALLKEKAENEALAKELDSQKAEIIKLQSDLKETTSECQVHITDIEMQNDELEKKNDEFQKNNDELQTQIKTLETQAGSQIAEIEELKKQILPDAEMLFYHSCKADLILAELYRERSTYTADELKAKNFPLSLFETGIETTNFKLENTGENQFRISEK